MGVLIPIQFVQLMGWWFYQAWTWIEDDSFGSHLAAWLGPISSASVGTCLLQWAMVFAVLIVFNRPLAERSIAGSPDQ